MFWRVIYHWQEEYQLFSFANEVQARQAYQKIPADATRMLAYDEKVVSSWFYNADWENRMRKYLKKTIDEGLYQVRV
jgi:hypothetical protein